MIPIVVTTTCATAEEARAIATDLLQHRLVACVQIAGPLTSSYWWQERIATEDEYHLVMKSVHSLFDRLADRITAIHSYEVPEIIATEVVRSNDAYRAWLITQLDISGHGQQ